MTRHFYSTVLFGVLAVVTGSLAKAQTRLPPPASQGDLTGPAWAHVLQQFDEWASVQQLYTPEQVRQWRAQILGKASSLPPADAAAFATDLSAKLQVLLSAEARDARKWLADTLAVASVSYAKEIKSELPDPQKMTASQIQARLDAFEARESNLKQVQASEQKTRQMQIQAIEADQRAQAAANAAAWQGGSGYYGSAYNPGANQHAFNRYYPPAGRIGAGVFFW